MWYIYDEKFELMRYKNETKNEDYHWFGICRHYCLWRLVRCGDVFYNVAVVPAPKSFLSKSKPIKKDDALYPAHKWYQEANKQRWNEISATRHLKLDANYIAAAKPTNKTVIIAHGFMSNKDNMFDYAYMFHNLGYNVLLPDARGTAIAKAIILAMVGRTGWTTLNGLRELLAIMVPTQKLPCLGPAWAGRQR